MAQFLRPDSNVTQTGFTGGFAEIDEVTPNDADFAYSAATASVLVVGLTNPSGTPGAGTSIVRYRIAKVLGGTLSSSGAVTVICSVYQGNLLIASDEARSPGGSFTQFSFTPNLSAVTNWNNLRLRFATSGGNRGVAVSWAEVEVPDSGRRADLAAHLLDAELSSSALILTPGGGSLVSELGNLTADSSGVLPLRGSFNPILGELTAAASAKIPIVANASISLSPILIETGGGAIPIPPIAGIVRVRHNLAGVVRVSPFSNMAGVIRIPGYKPEVILTDKMGSLSVELGPLGATIEGAGEVVIVGSVNATLGAVTLEGEGTDAPVLQELSLAILLRELSLATD